MKILAASAENFGSYKKLDFQFDKQGLALIHGPTGSGKSTLCDLVPWILFSTTAKGGKVDEVLSWPGDSVTKGTLSLYLPNGACITVERTRGSKAKDNDLLYWISTNNEDFPIRGKDIPDTQKLINQLLGMDADLYLSGAYYHEFSKTASFFTTTAKARRELVEQLVDLSLPKTLQARAQEAKKAIDIESTRLSKAQAIENTKLDMLEHRLQSAHHNSFLWDEKQTAKKNEIRIKSMTFDKTKADNTAQQETEIENLMRDIIPSVSLQNEVVTLQKNMSEIKDKLCPHCGAPEKTDIKDTILNEIKALERNIIKNQYAEHNLVVAMQKLKELHEYENTYAEQLIALEAESNPYHIECKTGDEAFTNQIALVKTIETDMLKLCRKESDFKQLLEVIADFRTVLIRSTIVELEEQTNALLTKHFDAEIRAEFNCAEADKIEVEIQKDGNRAVFSQLSKGQRQLLKLCFGLSVMKIVANKHGLDFNAVWIDEGFDGLSDEFKIKAYGLLQTLALDYSSVFVVEHSSELKSLFDNQFEIALTSEGSQVEQT